MAVETPIWKYKKEGDWQTASEMNQLAQSVIANAIELSNIEELVTNLAKDRKYEPDKYSGLGRVILRKNIVEIYDPIYGKVTKNILLQDMINQANTIYEIRYDFDLNNQTITIPENCILKFEGGPLIS